MYTGTTQYLRHCNFSWESWKLLVAKFAPLIVPLAFWVLSFLECYLVWCLCTKPDVFTWPFYNLVFCQYVCLDKFLFPAGGVTGYCTVALCYHIKLFIIYLHENMIIICYGKLLFLLLVLLLSTTTTTIILHLLSLVSMNQTLWYQQTMSWKSLEKRWDWRT